MKQASLMYKQAMDKQLRAKSYGLLSLGVVNKEAQNSASLSNTAYFSNNRSLLRKDQVKNTYASFEENHTKADGKYIFLQENGTYFQTKLDVGAVAENILTAIRVDFDNTYDIKGLTLDFGDSYPTEFTVSNGITTITYENNTSYFTCTDVFDDTNYFIITPIHFVGGDNKRLRLNYFLTGIGLVFDNSDISDVKISESVSYVSEELPSIQVTAKILNLDGLFNIDDDSSFINYLADGQPLDMSIGQTLEDGSIEYINLPTTYLSNWGNSGIYMTFTARDRFKLLDGTYSDGNTIHTRTLYDDAIAVLVAAGLEVDEYYVDSVLQDIEVSNPLPSVSYAECLQLIANAGRCSLRQDINGKILIEGNFENIIEPTDLTMYANAEADWSHVDNARFGSDVVYADFTMNFASADGSMLFLPEDNTPYLNSTFVSSEISDADGNFIVNPSVTLELPAAYTYYGLRVLFNGNHPKNLKLDVYYDSDLLSTYNFVVDDNDFIINTPLVSFNKLVFTFTKAEPYNRILVNKISLGEYTNYRLKFSDMLERPVKLNGQRVKDVQVKVCTYSQPEEGDPELVNDNVYETYRINSTGATVTFDNPLIGTSEHAQQVAEWMANYFGNNKTYQVKYRGEPRLDASDIIYMDNDKLNNLEVEIESLELGFNGALSGKLNLRRATNMLKEDA